MRLYVLPEARPLASHITLEVAKEELDPFWRRDDGPIRYRAESSDREKIQPRQISNLEGFRGEMARPTRFERVASTFGGWRSIQLSYGRISHCLVPLTSAGQRTRQFNSQNLSNLAGLLRPSPLCLSGSCLRDAYAEKCRPWVVR